MFLRRSSGSLSKENFHHDAFRSSEKGVRDALVGSHTWVTSIDSARGVDVFIFRTNRFFEFEFSVREPQRVNKTIPPT
jgi:hypothetical protein